MRGRRVNLKRSLQCDLNQRPAGVSVSVPPVGIRSTYRSRRIFALEGLWFGKVPNAKRDVQAQTWEQTAAPDCNPRCH
ncbi:hypothetical protein F7725_020694 [Dissostichus mawsoni]|uniref:Uncharacterized protein n=1 Tax=Dissostichus mawsoni TaxID=36200 RepID=A0A7J5YDW6_DISMA|nr:hypothetical protein F7725_020694 [Dissostichus mawsoni]